MKRFQCVRKCFAGGFLWEVGMVSDGEKAPLTRGDDPENIKEEFFKEVYGFTPHSDGMYTERQAILLELGELKARFNTTWPLDRLRILLKEYKEASLQTKGDILSELAVGIGVPPTENEALERLEGRIENKRREDLFTADVDRKTLMRELKGRGMSHSKYQSTEVLREKLAKAISTENALEKAGVE
jgi:hypothetical protein